MCLDLSKSGESSDKELSDFGLALGFVQFHTKGQLIWKEKISCSHFNQKSNKIIF